MTKWKIKHPLEICFPAHRRKLKILSWENWKNDTLLPMLSKITLASSFCMNTGSCKQGNSWCTLSPKKGLMKRKFSPSLLTVMYNKTKMDSTMDRWWCLELFFFFFHSLPERGVIEETSSSKKWILWCSGWILPPKRNALGTKAILLCVLGESHG
jgi:hypothetical protein